MYAAASAAAVIWAPPASSKGGTDCVRCVVSVKVLITLLPPSLSLSSFDSQEMMMLRVM